MTLELNQGLIDVGIVRAFGMQQIPHLRGLPAQLFGDPLARRLELPTKALLFGPSPGLAGPEPHSPRRHECEKTK